MSRGTTAGGQTHHAFLRLVSVKKRQWNDFLIVLLEVLFGFSSMLTKQRRSKNMSYFGELNRLLRFTFSTTNHRVFPYDCLAAHLRYGAFVFCHRTEFYSTRHCPLVYQFAHCTNMPTSVRYKIAFALFLHRVTYRCRLGLSCCVPRL
jgi:hypothetical protein